jgi:hypothetical protein
MAACVLLLAGLLLDLRILVFAASFGFILNLANLLPVRPLDGGRIMLPKPEGDQPVAQERDGGTVRQPKGCLVALVILGGVLLIMAGRSVGLFAAGAIVVYLAFLYFLITRIKRTDGRPLIPINLVPSRERARERAIPLALWATLVCAHAVGIYATAGAIQPP